MASQNPDELARLFSGVSVRDFIPISEETLLKSLNELRTVEKRPQLQTLPSQLIALEPKQKAQWFHRTKVEQKSLLQILPPTLKVPHLILNKTELNLITQNRQLLENNLEATQLTHLSYEEVDPNDLAFYYPSKSDKTVEAFITNSDTRLIGTPTYV